MGFFEESYCDDLSITDYYKGKTVFITGGTGFMGKVLIEKLLYSCPDLDRIYLLLRCKKGVKPEDRLTDLYASLCFDRLRREKPDVFWSKVYVIPGDIMEPELGISPENRELLISNVNIIFHVAASVRFDDTLKYAVTMNLKGTKEIVEMAKEMRNLSALIHTSTSYSNTNWDPVEEVMYPPHADWRDILEIVQEVDEHTLKVLTPKVLGELPNTYTFTKQLAEHVVYEYRGQLPVVIFRPSIVISSVEEPMKGWIDNFNGPVGLLVASGKGILRSIYSDPNLIADYMPVDIAIKAMVASAWSRGVRKLNPSDDIPIINCCAGGLNSITMGELLDMGRKLAPQVPLDNVMWTVNGDLTTSATIHYIKVLLLHLLPALLVDSILCLSGRKPMLVKIQRRIYTANLALTYYITQQWSFTNTNLLSLRSSIKEQDKKHFYYQIEEVDREEYFYNACWGGKRYLLKERDEDVPKARAHMKRMEILDNVVRTIFFGTLAWWTYNLSCVQAFIQNVVF